MTFEKFVEKWCREVSEYGRTVYKDSIDMAEDAWNEATKAEREACAKMCDDVAAVLADEAKDNDHKRTAMHMCNWLAREIRQRDDSNEQ